MTASPLNVLLYSSLFPSDQDPTRGIYNLHGFEPLARMCSLRVVSPVPFWRRFDSPGEWFSPRAERHKGLDVTYPVYWALPRVAQHWHASAIYRSVRSHVLRLHELAPFDAIIGSNAYPDIVVAARLADDIGCPLVSLVLGSDMNQLAQRPSLRPQIKRGLERSHVVVALARSLRSRVLELGIAPANVVVQHNGVDGARFVIRDRTQARRRLNYIANGPSVLYTGNLAFEKGPDVLLKAFQILRADPSCNAHLTFVGDGQMATALRVEAAALGILPHVSFAGRQSPDEVAWWMAACDVLCLPSRREGCPNVVLEALASGRPVVASAVGGVPELISSLNGVTVPADDPGALAAGLKSALERTWNPADLRASVASLTWENFSALFHDAIAASLSAPVAERAIPRALDESMVQ